MFSPISVYIYTSVYGSTCDWRTNIPWFSWQVKYRLPCTVPSFLPLGSSRMTPTHFPEAKRVFPIYATVPRWPLPMTSTREPTLAGRPPPSELILLLPLLVVWGQERKTLRRQKELFILSRKMVDQWNVLGSMYSGPKRYLETFGHMYVIALDTKYSTLQL